MDFLGDSRWIPPNRLPATGMQKADIQEGSTWDVLYVMALPSFWGSLGGRSGIGADIVGWSGGAGTVKTEW